MRDTKPLKDIVVPEAVRRLAYRLRWMVRSLPRRHSYCAVAAVLALATPACILIGHYLVGRELPPLSTIIDEVASIYRSYEYLTLWTALLALLGFLLGRKIDRLRSLSITDALTGLFNRRHLNERLADEMNRRARYDTSFSLLSIDLDGLKAINDGLGHKTGDCALLAVAGSISESMRASDIAARIGGDEFAVILMRTSATEAMALSKRIGAALANRCGPWRNSLSLSIGIATVNGATQGWSEDILLAADSALYDAKRAGGGRATVAQLSHAAERGPIILFTSSALIGGHA